MKRGMMALLAVSVATTMFLGGCASNDAVKPDEPVVSTSTSTDTKPIQQSNAGASDSRITPAGQGGQDSSASSFDPSGLEKIYFEFDKSDLSKEARDILSRNAQTMLKSKSGINVKVEGHCDERGSAEYNLALGERRAKSVQQYLITLGVQPDRLSVISYGKEKPAVQGNDEAAWSKNRRAEFSVAK
jgi:peptidoglycan-associated lipoprotein